MQKHDQSGSDGRGCLDVRSSAYDAPRVLGHLVGAYRLRVG